MLYDNIDTLKGVGPSKLESLEKKGIYTVEDLLYYFPRGHEDRTILKNIIDLVDGETVCIKATVFLPVKEFKAKSGLTLYTLVLKDGTGTLYAKWFNNKFIKGVFKAGETYTFYGKIHIQDGKKEIHTPDFEKTNLECEPPTEDKILPIYPLAENLNQKFLRKIMKLALNQLDCLDEYLPIQVLNEYNLPNIRFSICNMHFPIDFKSYQLARKRLIFEEFFLFQLAILARKNLNKNQKSPCFKTLDYTEEIIKLLPFELTVGQTEVINEISSDLSKPTPMNRLVQGDVGCGKTVVAIVAMYIAKQNGYQSAMMAPTEILAKQHYNTFTKILDVTKIKIGLLIGSMPKKEKEDVLNRLKNKEIDIVVGTHALIQSNVEFSKLGLAITDEQHRFGVKQRALLSDKSEGVHTLVMTATPIPRTMSLVIYGDLDISTIKDKPLGRKDIKTYAFDDSMRKRVYDFVQKSVNEATQVYIVCPIIEDSDKLDLKNVNDFCSHLKKLYPDFSISLIHGAMNSLEKEKTMQAFVDGQINILVSTTVIEVGVHVDNANIMVIENAERFGLSQLHQLRGRVGRGDKQAYCILFYQNANDTTKKRMEVMCKSSDGFFISEEDFKLRGPGEVLGFRQHGLPSFKIGNVFDDLKMLKLAQKAARKVLSQDHTLSKTDNIRLKERIEKMFNNEIIMN